MPVYIRAGKRLPLTAAEVVVEFHRPPREVFGEQGGRGHVRMRLGPDVCVAMGLRVKHPGEQMIGEIVELTLAEQAASLTPPYQRLLGDAMRGDSELFGREDVDRRAMAHRRADPRRPAACHEYEPGSWGPEAADALIGD